MSFPVHISLFRFPICLTVSEQPQPSYAPVTPITAPPSPAVIALQQAIAVLPPGTDPAVLAGLQQALALAQQQGIHEKKRKKTEKKQKKKPKARKEKKTQGKK